MAPREAFLEMLVRQVPAVLWTMDRDLRFTLSEGAGLKALGLRPGEAVGRTVFEFFRTSDRSFPPIAAHLKALEGESAAYEMAWAGRTFQTEVEPLVGPEGEVRGVVGIAVDVTAARLAEGRLQLQGALLDQVHSAILTTDRHMRVTYLNPYGEALLGWLGGEIRGRDAISLLVPAEEASLARKLREGVGRDGTWAGEFRVRRRDGEILVLDLEVTAITAANGRLSMFAFVGHDLTKRRRAEEARRAAEERYRGIFRNSLEGIFQSTPGGRILAANPALARMLGYGSEEEMLEAVRDVGTQHYADPGRRDEWRRLLEEKGELLGFEYEAVRRDGSRVLLSENVRAVKDGSGRVLHYEGMVQDVTERRRLEEELRQSQKMEAMGRLAGGVAHDFNNILTVIGGYGELVLDMVEEGSEVRPHIEQIRGAADRAAALAGQLLAFSRKQVLEPRAVDLSAFLAGSEGMLRRLVRESVRIEIRPAPAPAFALVDPGQMTQVLLNLAANASDAMPGGGRLSFEVRTEPGPGRGSVVLVVEDEGEGIPPDAIDRIFEPFFTTKNRGQGVGLGLATVYGIVRQSGGDIRVQSEAGRGTRFRVEFPRAAPPPAADATAAATGAPRGGSERILVVEDERPILGMVRRTLAGRGYTVTTASNGEEALALVIRDGPPDLLLTDVVMPRMGGGPLARVLRERHPGLKVLFTSGYNDDALMQEGISEREEAFLRKPFSTDQLLARVREALEAAVGGPG